MESKASPSKSRKAIRVGIGGPVGSGKSTLCLKLCERYGSTRNMAVITNDIYTKEDAKMLIRHAALPESRILGVETGGCPHTAIRDDISMNLEAVDDLQERFPDLEFILIESGGDNLTATSWFDPPAIRTHGCSPSSAACASTFSRPDLARSRAVRP